MHRIDTSTAQVDKFGAGKNGFTGGNPQTGELPTALDADFFDSVQEEIAGVIEAAGIALKKDTNTQLLAAMKTLVGPGRLLNTQTFTATGTYTPTPGTKKIKVRGVGTGGTGAGSGAVSSSNASCLSGGASAGWAEAVYLTGFNGVTVTIGALGAKGTGNGGAGGQSSFGTLMVIPGGGGGVATSRSATETYYENGGGSPSIPVISGHLAGYVAQGGNGERGRVLTGYSSGGGGGNTPYGSGGPGRASTSGASAAGFDATGYGAGGGAASAAASSAAVLGGYGSLGIFIVEEYA